MYQCVLFVVLFLCVETVKSQVDSQSEEDESFVSPVQLTKRADVGERILNPFGASWTKRESGGEALA